MTTSLIGVVALVATMVAGCSSDSAPSSGTSPPTSRAPLVIPAVRNPLDATKFREAPCNLITGQQAVELGLPVAKEKRAGSRVECAWQANKDDPSPLEALRIHFLQANGLAGMAKQCKSDCDSWTVTQIAGYPAIRANGQIQSKYGMCSLFVGVADTVAFMVNDGDLDAITKGATEGDAGGPRCDRADRAVTMVIQKLKEGG